MGKRVDAAKRNLVIKYPNRKLYSYREGTYLTLSRASDYLLKYPDTVFVDAQGNNISEFIIRKIVASEVLKNGSPDLIKLLLDCREHGLKGSKDSVSFVQ